MSDRRRWDLPEGVADGDVIASNIVAELAHAEAVRKVAAARQRANYQSRAAVIGFGGVLLGREDTARGRLMDRARTGDAAAIAELRNRYGLTLIVTPPPRPARPRRRGGRRRR